jgi:hypothetical protein
MVMVQLRVAVLMMIATCVTVFLLLGPFASAEERLVREFRYGAGTAELGLIDGAEDALGAGPAALAVQNGTFFIIDRVKSRILRFRSTDGQIDAIDLGADSDPIDLVVLGGTTYVRDAVSSNLIRINAGGVAASPGQLEAAGTEVAVRTATSVLFQAGFRVPGGRTGGPEIGTGELGRIYAIGPEMLAAGDPGQWVIAPGGQAFTARFVPSPLRLSGEGTEYRGEVVVAPVANLEQSTRLVIRLPGLVKAARLVAIAADGRLFVDLDEIVNMPEKGDIVRRTVVEYDAMGNRLGWYDVPLSPLGDLVTRPVIVDSDGKVYALVVASDVTRVIELPRFTTDVIGTVAPVLPPSPPLLVPGTVELGPPAFKVSRLEILTLANQYVTTRWEAPQTAFTTPSGCNPANSSFWQRPRHITKVGESLSGVPYCWGCADSVGQFLQATHNGTKLPGNICARRDCNECVQPQKTAGVDCSGFVSNVWRLEKRVTTSSLSSVALPVTRYEELELGDVFNHAGRHVVMYAGKVATSVGEMVMIYESSLTCGGTCLRAVPWSALGGYTPLRRLNIAN